MSKDNAEQLGMTNKDGGKQKFKEGSKARIS